MIKKTILLISLNTLFFNTSWAGQEGHGGDMAVSIFIGIASTVNNCLQSNAPKEYPLLVGELRFMIQKAKVYSVEKTILNGHEVDAINYPDQDNPRVLLNRARWLKPDIRTDFRAGLVLHEYLSLLGYQDDLYQISYPLVQKNKDCINLN